MENILSAAKAAVGQSFSMGDYYEKEVAKYERLLGEQKVKAKKLKEEYDSLEIMVNNSGITS